MNDSPPGSRTATRTGLAALSIGAIAVLCCAGLPLIAAVLGGIALGSALGLGGAVLAVVVVIALIVARARRQRSCANPRVRSRRGGEA